jgi:hypothetical protein
MLQRLMNTNVLIVVIGFLPSLALVSTIGCARSAGGPDNQAAAALADDDEDSDEEGEEEGEEDGDDEDSDEEGEEEEGEEEEDEDDEDDEDELSGVGGTCTSAADCGEGLDACNDDPGGQCTHECTQPSDCAAIDGAICEFERPGNCYKLCTSDADCDREGYGCVGGPNQEGQLWCDVLE